MRIICFVLFPVSFAANRTAEFQWIQNQLSEESEVGHSGAWRIRDLLSICWENPNLTPWDLIKADII